MYVSIYLYNKKYAFISIIMTIVSILLSRGFSLSYSSNGSPPEKLVLSFAFFCALIVTYLYCKRSSPIASEIQEYQMKGSIRI